MRRATSRPFHEGIADGVKRTTWVRLALAQTNQREHAEDVHEQRAQQ
jgi:hypothetical protein